GAAPAGGGTARRGGPHPPARGARAPDRRLRRSARRVSAGCSLACAARASPGTHAGPARARARRSPRRPLSARGRGGSGAFRSCSSDPGLGGSQPRAVPWIRATLGDNGGESAPMIAENKTRQAMPVQLSQRLCARLRPLARGVLWRFAPFYARRRAMRADVVARLGRLESELKRVRERHEEQIERLEDLARELVLTAESLRRSVLGADTARTDAPRDAERRMELLGTELNELPYLAGRPFEPLDSPVGEVLGYRSAAPPRAGGSRPVGVEGVFRGPAG